ncbi:3-deoxy-D-manno-octulosonic acid transferase [Pulveribacter sp.]|uniref:3-deoxy-D-manno-octulosonic acid transferase n=1 Tax=Pulveribacter sp. TaxID=2678893 RepID=UPI0028A27F5B|nr:3-deoxy-D-manno-octulosonic acid transferase [Pulveribacter sp.]
MQRFALWLYALATCLATPLLRAKLRRRALAEPAYGQHVDERFGHYGPALDSVQPQAEDERFVWIHAVSLGETRAAALLLKELRPLLPGMRLLLTHGTATGRAEGAALLQPGDVQLWLPWDTPGATRRFVRHFRPAIGILMETEVWPCLAAACRRAGVPLVLANARLNEKSRAGARRLAWLARPAYSGLTAVWAQTEADAERLRSVGAPVAAVLGNLKFDVVPPPAQQAHGRAWRAAATRPVALLASSREGEEALWLAALQSNRPPTQAGQAPAAIKTGATGKLQWLLVPRHPQRFDEVERLCRAAGLTVSRRSRWTAGPEAADVWLGDSMGEMALYYGLAHVALLGGSFERLGGQNLIEAAACGCPVVMGPHTFNFAEAAELALKAGAAERVPDMASAVQAAAALVLDVPAQARAAGRCLAFAEAHRGGALATALAIVQQLRRPTEC